MLSDLIIVVASRLDVESCFIDSFVDTVEIWVGVVLRRWGECLRHERERPLLCQHPCCGCCSVQGELGRNLDETQPQERHHSLAFRLVADVFERLLDQCAPDEHLAACSELEENSLAEEPV